MYINLKFKLILKRVKTINVSNNNAEAAQQRSYKVFFE